MERTNMWAKRAHSRDTRDSGNMKSETSQTHDVVKDVDITKYNSLRLSERIEKKAKMERKDITW